MSYFNTIVVGSGPAGITASLYLKRAGKSTLLLEKNVPGGLVNMASDIENYPGFDKIDGPTLAMNMFTQIMNAGIEFRNEEAVSIKNIGDKKEVATNKDVYTCDHVIIATGRIPKRLGLPNEKELTGRGVSFCALCDGNFFKNKDVSVVGGGNSALNEALYLANIANSVTLIHRRDSFRAEKETVEKVLQNTKIKVMYDANIIEIKAQDDKLKALVVKTKEEEVKLDVEGLFVYVGFEPQTELFKELDIQTEDDYIIVDENYETNIKGIYACGDIIKKDLYQIVTATAEGATAAHHIISK